MKRLYRTTTDLPASLPVFPLAGCLLLPRCELPLNIFEPRYLAMVDAVLAGDRLIGMIQPSTDDVAPGQPDLSSVGCVGRLIRFAETDDGRYLISLEGVCRFRIGAEIEGPDPFRRFNVDFAEFSEDFEPSSLQQQPDRVAVLNALRAYALRNAIEVDWRSVEKASDETLINVLSMLSPFGAKEKQALLEARDLRARGQVLVAIAEMDMAAMGRGRAPLH